MSASDGVRFTHAIVMGDLVDSEDTRSVERLHAAFNATISAANERRASALVSPLTITLGDEFQGLATSLRGGLAITRALRLALLGEGVDCRFVVGLARVDTPLNRERAWNMMGPGLSDARDRLADKRDPNRHRFSLPGEPLLETLLDAIGRSLTHIETDWTARQFDIVRASMETDRQVADLARLLAISERALYKHRRAANLPLYDDQWRAAESALDHLDARYRLG
ncbi:MAG: SatD family protein [Caulobacterales bacterium]|nr:SatD family protein [Caulobacterales bacterium]